MVRKTIALFKRDKTYRSFMKVFETAKIVKHHNSEKDLYSPNHLGHIELFVLPCQIFKIL
jgi:hypothetical protein